MLPASGSSDSFLRHLKQESHLAHFQYISIIISVYFWSKNYLIWVVSLKKESFLLYFWWKCFFIVWNDFSRDLWKGMSSEEIWCSWISKSRSNNGTWLANASTSFSFSTIFGSFWIKILGLFRLKPFYFWNQCRKESFKIDSRWRNSKFRVVLSRIRLSPTLFS